MKNIGKEFDVQEVKEILENITKVLGYTKELESKTKRAMVIRDNKEEFVVAMILSYSDNGEGMPGNYSLAMTFIEEDISTIDENDILYPSLINHITGMGLSTDSSDEVIEETISGAFSSIIEGLKSMPLEEEISFELDGYFTITRSPGEEQGDDDIFSIVPGSVLKRLIKNDELLEGTIEE